MDITRGREAGRNWFIVMLGIMLAGGPLMALAVPPVSGDGEGDYPPPTEGDWLITGETTVTGEHIVLRGNLTIAPGGVLTLVNTSVLFDCSFHGEFGVRVMSGGELQVMGFREHLPGQRLPGDLDMVSGSDPGVIRFYRNDGTINEPVWQNSVNLRDENGNEINVGQRSAPFLADLDNDGDLDLIIGERYNSGQVHYFENVGNATDPVWMRDTSMFSGVNVGDSHSKPTLADLDNDGDLDLIVGANNGRVYFFENIGTPESAKWGPRITMRAGGSEINLGGRTWPTFADINGNGRLDMLVGLGNGNLAFYRNTGTPEAFQWTRDDSVFSGVTAGQYNAAPAFADLDGDGLLDLTIGSYQSGLFFYRNTGTPEEPQWTRDTSMFEGVPVNQRMQPAFGDVDGDGPGFLPGELVWHTEFATTGDPSFTFVVEAGAIFEMEDTRVRNCGDADAGVPGMTLMTDASRIVGCSFDLNEHGLTLNGASDTLVSETRFGNNTVALHITGGTGNAVVNASFTNNSRGLLLDGTEGAILQDSVFHGCGVTLEGDTRAHYASHVMENLTVNGRPLYYYTGVHGVTVPADAGSVIIADSTDMTVRHLAMVGGDAGIQLAFVTGTLTGTLVEDVSIRDAKVGISVARSTDLLVRYCTVTGGDTGILVTGGTDNLTVIHSTLTGTRRAAVDASGNGGFEVEARRNHWGSASGPYHPVLNAGGTGDTVTDHVLFAPWLPGSHGTNRWYVDVSAPPDGDGTPARPFTSIRDALDMASRGEDIMVAAGTYAGGLVVPRQVNVFGHGGPAPVLIDAEGGTGLSIAPGAGGAVLSNLSLTNGTADLAVHADASLYNVSFDGGKVSFTRGAVLSVGSYLDLTAVDDDGRPVPGTGVTLTDARGVPRTLETGPDGSLSNVPVPAYLRDADGVVELTPHTLRAFHFATGSSLTVLDLQENTALRLTLLRYGSFGSSLATGDLDGDGIMDLAVGAPDDSQNGDHSGAVFLFFGPLTQGKVLRPLDADVVIHGEGNGTRFGETLAIADLNNDGRHELITGIPSYRASRPGLLGRYYRNTDFTDLGFTRLDPVIDFPWSGNNPEGLGNSFSIAWEGYLYVAEADEYTFYAEIDDTLRFRLDGTTVISRTTYSAAEAVSSPVFLEPGFHPLSLDFTDTGGACRLILKWSGSSIPKQVIPAEHFYSYLDTGEPDGGIFVFRGTLFSGGSSSVVTVGDALVFTADGEGLGTTLGVGDLDRDGYADILAGHATGTEVIHGRSSLAASLRRSSLPDLYHVVMVEIGGDPWLAGVMYGEVRVFPVGPDVHRLESFSEAVDFTGTFNFTTYDDGLTIYAYQRVEVLANGDFGEGWDNWTRTDSIRGLMDGTWDLTTTPRGDWWVYDDGPTAGLGPDRDRVASSGGQGRNCDGKLVSDPFLLPAGVDLLDFWHHAKWWSFERASQSQYQDAIDDFISIRVVRDADDTIVAERYYGLDHGGVNGEQDGRLQFDVSGEQGVLLRFVMELSNNLPGYDDGLVQIADIVGLRKVPEAQGDFISDPMELGSVRGAVLAHWETELNDGEMALSYRTNASDPWTPLERGTFADLSGTNGTAFQYRVDFSAGPGGSYPVLTELLLHFYAELPVSFGPGLPYTAGGIFGNSSLAVIDDSGTTAVVYDGTDPAVVISSDHPMNALSACPDIDGNGVPDLVVSSGSTVYVIPMDRSGGLRELDLADIPHAFAGEDGFGTVLHGVWAGSPREGFGDGRVYLLPTGMNDTAIVGLGLEVTERVHPGTTLPLVLTLQNRGLFAMDDVVVTLEIDDGEGYTHFDSQVVSLAVWESLMVTFDWSVPAVEGATYLVSFGLSGDDQPGNNELTVTLHAHYHEPVIGTTKDYDAIAPGGVLWYGLEVADHGTFGSDLLTFASDTLDLWGWEWWVVLDGENVTSVAVAGEDPVRLDLFVRPSTLELGEYSFTLTAVSRNGYTLAPQGLVGHIVLRDLVPTGVRLLRSDGNEGRLVAGDDCRVILSVLNAGTQSTGGFVIALDRDGTSMGTEPGPQEGLAGGAAANITFVRTFAEGVHNLTFMVDPDDAVKEYDESNNLFLLQITVWPGSASSGFVFRVRVVDLDGENVPGANVTITELVSGDGIVLDDSTDDSGNATLHLAPPYQEGRRFLVEGFFLNLYGRTEVQAYSEDGEVTLVIPVGRYSFDLRIRDRDKYIAPAGQQTFTFTLTNTGVFTDRFSVSLSGLPAQWSGFFTGPGLSDDTLTLGSGDSGSFTLSVTAHIYAPAYHRYEPVVSVSSHGAPFLRESVRLRLSVTLADNITLESDTLHERGLPGDPITHRVMVYNRGNTPRTVNLFVLGDTGYSSLRPQDLEFTLGIGGSRVVLFLIEVPNLRNGTVLQHQLVGVVAGVGAIPALNFTTVIDPRTTGYYLASVDGIDLVITHTGNRLDPHLEVRVTSGVADVSLSAASFPLDMGETVRVRLTLTMTDPGIPAGSMIGVFVSLFNGERYFINGTRYVAAPAVHDVTLSVSDPVIPAIPGSLVEIPVLVVNVGNIETLVGFAGTNSGPEPLIMPSPVTLVRNGQTTVMLRVPLSADMTTPRVITFTATAGGTVRNIEVTLDPDMARALHFAEISARTGDAGTRYTLNLYNTGDMAETVRIETTCGDLELVQAVIGPKDHVQFRLLVPHGTFCGASIEVTAVSTRGSDLNTRVVLTGPPVVKITLENGMPGRAREPVIFRADGAHREYIWSIEGRTILSRQVWYNFTSPGVYPVTLTVKDQRELRSVYHLEVVIENQPPVIVMPATVYGDAGTFISLDARSSYDPDGVITEFTWIIEGRIRQGPTIFHQFNEPGTYTVPLTVTDDFGLTSSRNITVTIRPTHAPSSDTDGGEDTELNMIIIWITLAIIIIVVITLIQYHRNLDYEENYIVERLTEIENRRNGFRERGGGRAPPGAETVTKEVQP